MNSSNNSSTSNSDILMTGNKTGYEVDDIPNTVCIFGALLGIFMVGIGIPGNVMLMVASLMKPSDIDKTGGTAITSLNLPDIFVFSLAVNDAVFLLISGCLNVYTYLIGSWKFGPTTCKVLFVTDQLCHTLALEHIGAIGLLRYLAVVHNKRIKPKWYSTLVALGIMFLVPLILILNFMPNELVFFSKTMNCISLETASGQRSSPSVMPVISILAVIGFGLALCYLHIYIHVRRSRASVEDAENTTMREIFSKREIKLIRTIVYVFLSFSITFPIVPLLLAMDTGSNWPFGIFYIGVVADTLTGCLNWIIYGITNDWIRQKYRLIVTCQIWTERKRPNQVAPVENCENNLHIPRVKAGSSRSTTLTPVTNVRLISLVNTILWYFEVTLLLQDPNWRLLAATRIKF